MIVDVNATSPREAGEQHGAQARAQIRGWLQSGEMRRLLTLVGNTSAGRAAFSALRSRNAGAFPRLAEEVR